MKKSVLFLDFDGMKFDTAPLHVAYFNKKYGINCKKEDFLNNPPYNHILRKYLPAHLIPSAEELWRDACANLMNSISWHQDVPPMDGMCEVLPELAKKYVLWTVTARPSGSMEVMQYLVDKHVPGCISGFHCVWFQSEDRLFRGISKLEFIQKFTGDKVGFIDDSVKEILQLQAVIPSYLFDPSGLNDTAEGIERRVRSWEEIGKIFL